MNTLTGNSIVFTLTGNSIVFTVTGNSIVFTVTGKSIVNTLTGNSIVFTVTGNSIVFTVTGNSIQYFASYVTLRARISLCLLNTGCVSSLQTDRFPILPEIDRGCCLQSILLKERPLIRC